MRKLLQVALCLLVFAVSSCALDAYAQSGGPSVRVGQASSEVKRWLGEGAGAQQWSKFLRLDDLNAQVAKGDQADVKAVETVLGQLKSGAKGLELAPFVNLRVAVEIWQSHLTGKPLDSMGEEIVSAGARFEPVTEATYNKSKADLVSKVTKLNAYLGKLGANGVAWKKYLRWAEMEEQIAAGLDAKTNVIREIAMQYYNDNVGLEMPQFADVGRALRSYANVTYAFRETNLPSQYADRLSQLGTLLATYKADPSMENAFAVESQLSWLERNGEPTELLAKIRQEFTKPNAVALLDEELITAGARRNINEVTPVRDNILGTSISGTGRTIGRIDAGLVPDQKHATFDLSLRGTTYTNTTGINRSAVIHTNGVTSIAGDKRIMLDESGLHEFPARARANTKTRITGIGSTRGGLLGKIVTNAAKKRAPQQKGQAEQIGSRKAESRIRERMDQEAAVQLTKANRDFESKFRDPLRRANIYPQLLQFSSTNDDAFVNILQASMSQLGAPSVPPVIKGDYDLQVVGHQSAVNNAAATMFAGRTLTDSDIKAEVLKRRGSLPDEMKNDQDQDPWSITFVDEHPIGLSIGDGGFKLTIHGKRFTSGDRKFKAMDITSTYKAEKHGQGMRLTRQGDIEIFPPGFDREKGRFSVDQVALRSILRKKFGKMFKEEIVVEGMVLPGRLKEMGKLPIADFRFDNGWVSIVWDRKEQTRTAKVTTTSVEKAVEPVRKATPTTVLRPAAVNEGHVTPTAPVARPVMKTTSAPMHRPTMRRSSCH